MRFSWQDTLRVYITVEVVELVRPVIEVDKNQKITESEVDTIIQKIDLFQTQRGSVFRCSYSQSFPLHDTLGYGWESGDLTLGVGTRKWKIRLSC